MPVARKRNVSERLTPKQEKYVQGIIKGMTQADAYRAAYGQSNYKHKTIQERASRLANEPKVKARLEQLQARVTTKAASRAVMTRVEALERLSNFARTDLADLVEFGNFQVGEDEDGQPILNSTWKFKPSALVDPEKLAAIAELASSKDGLRIKTHSPLQAIQQLAKMQGWEAAAKHEVTGANGKDLIPSVDVSKLGTDVLLALVRAKKKDATE